MLFIKPGVKLKGIQPEILVGLYIVEAVIGKLGLSTTVTSALDGVHMEGSLHYKGLAVDIRSKEITLNTDKANVITDSKAALGDEYDFIIEDEDTENSHFHLEFDPK